MTRPEGVYRRPWWWRIPVTACRCGLHFMAWDGRSDGFVCSCRRQFLWAEQIRNRHEFGGS